MTANAFGIDQESFLGESFCIYDGQKDMLAELRVIWRKMFNMLKDKQERELELVESVQDLYQPYRKLKGNISKIINWLNPSVRSNPKTESDGPKYRFSGTGRAAPNNDTIRYYFEDVKMSHYLCAIAIMLCINDESKLSQMVVDNFDTTLSQTELTHLLQYISRQLKQKIIVLSKENEATNPANNEMLWLYRNYLVCICN